MKLTDPRDDPARALWLTPCPVEGCNERPVEVISTSMTVLDGHQARCAAGHLLDVDVTTTPYTLTPTESGMA